jgi:hypothetical protein
MSEILDTAVLPLKAIAIRSGTNAWFEALDPLIRAISAATQPGHLRTVAMVWPGSTEQLAHRLAIRLDLLDLDLAIRVVTALRHEGRLLTVKPFLQMPAAERAALFGAALDRAATPGGGLALSAGLVALAHLWAKHSVDAPGRERMMDRVTCLAVDIWLRDVPADEDAPDWLAQVAFDAAPGELRRLLRERALSERTVGDLVLTARVDLAILVDILGAPALREDTPVAQAAIERILREPAWRRAPEIRERLVRSPTFADRSELAGLRALRDAPSRCAATVTRFAAERRWVYVADVLDGATVAQIAALEPEAWSLILSGPQEVREFALAALARLERPLVDATAIPMAPANRSGTATQGHCATKHA